MHVLMLSTHLGLVGTHPASSFLKLFKKPEAVVGRTLTFLLLRALKSGGLGII